MGSKEPEECIGSVNVSLEHGHAYATLDHPGVEGASASTCKVSLFGAHVVSWVVDGEERLFLSEVNRDPVKNKAGIEAKKEIIGGIPVCWPQFADQGDLPMHGVAMISDAWQVLSMGKENDLHPYITLYFQYKEVGLTYTVVLKERSLICRMKVENGDNDEFLLPCDDENIGDKDNKEEKKKEAEKESGPSFDFTCALHTYFRVNLRENCAVHVKGLDKCDFWNKVTKSDSGGEDGPVIIDGSEICDRIYKNSPKKVTIEQGDKCLFTVEKENFADTIVWNIGEEKSKEFFIGGGPEEHLDYICVECGNASKSVEVPYNGVWEANQILTV